jgi:hypothetical protein
MKSFAGIVSKSLLMIAVFVLINLVTITLFVDEEEWTGAKRTSESINVTATTESQNVGTGTKIVKKLGHLLSTQINHILHQLDKLHVIGLVGNFMKTTIQKSVYELANSRFRIIYADGIIHW